MCSPRLEKWKNGIAWVIKKDSCLLRQTAAHISLHEKQKKCQDVHQKCVCMSKQASQSKSLKN